MSGPSGIMSDFNGTVKFTVESVNWETVCKLVIAENARLRELVADMWTGMCGYGHDCRSCEHYELFAGQRFVGECEFFTRMRELGIEVDG